MHKKRQLWIYDYIEVPVQVGVGRPLNVQVPLADVIDGLIVNLGKQ